MPTPTSRPYQGSPFVELFTATGSKPLGDLKINVPKAVKRVYDKHLKASCVVIDGDVAPSCRVVVGGLGVTQPILVMQIMPSTSGPLYFEFCCSDGKSRRRVVLSTAVTKPTRDPLHVKLPIQRVVHRSGWVNLCFHLREMFSVSFPSLPHPTVETITIGPSCKIKRIWSIKSLDVPLPEFPSSVPYVTQMISLKPLVGKGAPLELSSVILGDDEVEGEEESEQQPQRQQQPAHHVDPAAVGRCTVQYSETHTTTTTTIKVCETVSATTENTTLPVSCGVDVVSYSPAAYSPSPKKISSSKEEEEVRVGSTSISRTTASPRASGEVKPTRDTTPSVRFGSPSSPSSIRTGVVRVTPSISRATPSTAEAAPHRASLLHAGSPDEVKPTRDTTPSVRFGSPSSLSTRTGVVGATPSSLGKTLDVSSITKIEETPTPGADFKVHLVPCEETVCSSSSSSTSTGSSCDDHRGLVVEDVSSSPVKSARVKPDPVLSSVEKQLMAVGVEGQPLSYEEKEDVRKSLLEAKAPVHDAGLRYSVETFNSVGVGESDDCCRFGLRDSDESADDGDANPNPFTAALTNMAAAPTIGDDICVFESLKPGSPAALSDWSRTDCDAPTTRNTTLLYDPELRYYYDPVNNKYYCED